MLNPPRGRKLLNKHYRMTGMQLAVPVTLQRAASQLNVRLQRPLKRDERFQRAVEQLTGGIVRRRAIQADPDLIPPAAGTLPNPRRLEQLLVHVDARHESGIGAKSRIEILMY